MTFKSKLQLLITPCILCPALLVIVMTFFITGSKIKAMQYEILENHLNHILSLCETEYDLIKKLKMEEDQYYREAVIEKVLSEIRQIRNQTEKIWILQTTMKRLIYLTGRDRDVRKKALPDVPYIDEMISSKTGRIEFRDQIDGPPHKMTIAAFTYFPNWDWLIIVSLTKDDVYKYVYSATFVSLFITALFLIIVFLISYRISLGISKPLEQLEAGVNKIARQDYDINLEIESKDEFGEIAKKFNLMAHKIKEDALSIRKFSQELEQRVAERTRELEIARNKAQQYLDIAGVILVAIDADRRVTLINQKGCEILGRPTEEIIAKDWFETFVPAYLRQDAIQDFHHLMAGEIEPDGSFENPVLTERGEERLIAWHNVILRNEGGRIVGTLSSGEDITERRHMEQIVQKSAFLFEKSQELGKIGGWDWNPSTNASTWTEQVYHIHEIPLDEPPADRIAKSLRCYRPDDRLVIHAAFKDCLEKGIPYDLEFPFSGYLGTEKWIRTGAIPEFEGDKVVYVYGYIMDITEHKRAEAHIRRLNQALQERAAALEAANKELEAFAYSVSHDLRAPLRHIGGFLDLLQKRTAGSLDELSQHHMANIAEAARRMGLLIDDLLSFSRMGRKELSMRPVALNLIVRGILQELEPETRGRTIHWQIADLPVVMGDRSLLRVVLVNLLTNAVKFTRPLERAEIEIGCQPGQDADEVIFVRDNGVGFNMQYADKLFGVFQRLHRAEDFEGTGIGLANVRRIISRHGGRVWAEGQVNHGAVFYFSLPRPPQDGAVEQPPSVEQRY